MKKEDKPNKISDSELSLISVISGLDNKLEELDHNLALISKAGNHSLQVNINEKEINKKIQDLEKKILNMNNKLSAENQITTNEKYINTLPTKSRIGPTRKGYALADNLRLKRIDSIEKQLNDLSKKFDEKFQIQSNQETSLINSCDEDDSQDYFETPNDSYLRSRGIFFAFIFSIIIIFLLIIVSTGTNIFI